MANLFKRLKDAIFKPKPYLCKNHVYYYAGGLHTQRDGWAIDVRCLNKDCQFKRTVNLEEYERLLRQNRK